MIRKIMLLLLVAALKMGAQTDVQNGKGTFENKCAWCHGKDGARGRFGAKDLRQSTLTDLDYFTVIANGKNGMPTWKKRLNNDQIKLVINYIKQFRKP